MGRIARVAAAIALVVCAAGCRTRAARALRQPDILLISIDTLRADRLGAYGYSGRTSPFIDSLAARGVVYTRAFVPMPATDPSHASLFTSLHPLKHLVRANAMALADGFETLAEVLTRAGYYTMGAIAVDHLGSAYGFHQGFARYADAWSDSEAGNDVVQRDAEAVNRDVYRMVNEYAARGTDRPYFLFVHYFDPHAPYLDRDAPGAASRAGRANRGPADDGRASDAARYDSEIRYVDRQIRDLIRHLVSRRLADNLVICVTSDHGEQLGEHGFSGGHKDLYTETVRVPLILAGGRHPPPGVNRSLVSSMDIAPTLLSLARTGFPGIVDGVALPGPSDGTGGGGDAPPGAPAARGLLTIGYPSYTRSFAFTDGDHYFIRNLDYVYRDLFIEAIAPVGSRGAASRASGAPLHELPLLRAEGGENTYQVRLHDIEPHFVTLEIHPARPGCDLRAGVYLRPKQIPYGETLPITAPTRIHYPVARLDSTLLTLTPASCVGRVAYTLTGFAAFRARLDGAVSARTTGLFDDLVQRRRAPVDELYDLRVDPGMLVNLAGRAPESDRARGLRDEASAAFSDSYRMPGGLPGEYSDEEIDRLRSLGYID